MRVIDCTAELDRAAARYLNARTAVTRAQAGRTPLLSIHALDAELTAAREHYLAVRDAATHDE